MATSHRGERTLTSNPQVSASLVSNARGSDAGYEPGSGRSDRQQWLRVEAVQGGLSGEPHGKTKSQTRISYAAMPMQGNREVREADRNLNGNHNRLDTTQGRRRNTVTLAIVSILLLVMKASAATGRSSLPATTWHTESCKPQCLLARTGIEPDTRTTARIIENREQTNEICAADPSSTSTGTNISLKKPAAMHTTRQNLGASNTLTGAQLKAEDTPQIELDLHMKAQLARYAGCPSPKNGQRTRDHTN